MHIRPVVCALVCTALICRTEAVSAPFCAVFSYDKHCWYYDIESCKEAAGALGICLVNQNEARAPLSGSSYCTVTSSGMNCRFYNAESCRAAAASIGAVCVVNPPTDEWRLHQILGSIPHSKHKEGE